MATWKKVLIGVAGVVLLAIVVGSSLLSKKKPTGEEVYFAKAAKKDILASVTGSGKIEPKTKVNVQSSVIGEIKKLPVKEGSVVRKGDLLVQIDPDRYQAEVDRLEAALRMNRIAIAQEKVRLENARKVLTRHQGLNREGFVAPEALERAELDVRMGEINLDSLQEQVTQADAALAKARDELRKTTITSPMDGLVTQLNAEIGEITMTGTMNNPGTVIMVVSDMSEVLAEVDVDETAIVKVKPGQSARVVVDAVGELHPYTGHVTEIAGTAVQRAGEQVQVFPVKIALANPDERLRPGMTAKARIEAARSDATVTVPIQAVLLKPATEVAQAFADRGKKAGKGGKKAEPGKPIEAGTSPTTADGGASAPPAEANLAVASKNKEGMQEVVFKVVDGKAVLTRVKSGISDETTVAILDGIAEGDQVVTGPYRSVKKLKDGEAVREKKGSAGEDKEGQAQKEGEEASFD